MAQQAQDTFIAVLDDGTERLVTKGEVFADGHELVKRDLKGSGMLFRKLDLGEDEEAKPKPAARKAARSDG
jgi:hypothetical protein